MSPIHFAVPILKRIYFKMVSTVADAPVASATGSDKASSFFTLNAPLTSILRCCANGSARIVCLQKSPVSYSSAGGHVSVT